MTNTTTKQKSVAIETTSAGLNKIGVNTIGIASALIGFWAAACLGAGMISSGGPVSLVSNFVKALVG